MISRIRLPQTPTAPVTSTFVLGSIDITKAYLGSIQILKIMKGSIQIL